jgi:hypothetical protein
MVNTRRTSPTWALHYLHGSLVDARYHPHDAHLRHPKYIDRLDEQVACAEGSLSHTAHVDSRYTTGMSINNSPKSALLYASTLRSQSRP